jgi:hypothetical protein
MLYVTYPHKLLSCNDHIHKEQEQGQEQEHEQEQEQPLNSQCSKTAF